MLMRLRMLNLSVGKGRQVMKQLCLRHVHNTTVATERTGYVLYRALVMAWNMCDLIILCYGIVGKH